MSDIKYQGMLLFCVGWGGVFWGRKGKGGCCWPEITVDMFLVKTYFNPETQSWWSSQAAVLGPHRENQKRENPHLEHFSFDLKFLMEMPECLYGSRLNSTAISYSNFSCLVNNTFWTIQQCLKVSIRNFNEQRSFSWSCQNSLRSFPTTCIFLLINIPPCVTIFCLPCSELEHLSPLFGMQRLCLQNFSWTENSL